MKINEVIKERRLAKGLTQEQVAKYLGITAPAVNKWEKGASYPDITLLPALARLLGTDLNTLLSFKEELTEREIALFLNDLAQLAHEKGLESAYTHAMEKVQEYPTCYPLLLNVAAFLDGFAVLQGKQDSIPEYRATAESLYQRALCSEDSRTKHLAQSKLISRCMERKEYDKAQELLNQLPDKSPVDKKQLQVKLLIAQDKFGEAAKLEEEKLLSTTQELASTLLTLMDIAIKQGRMDDAEYIADVYQKSAKAFDLGEYSSYLSHFELYSRCKNRMKFLKVLVPMLKSLTRPWEINQSPLYRHLKTKPVEKGFGYNIRNTLIKSIREDANLDFVQGSKELEDALKPFDAEKENPL